MRSNKPIALAGRVPFFMPVPEPFDPKSRACFPFFCQLSLAISSHCQTLSAAYLSFLFVYGTLRQAGRHEMAGFLAANSRFVGLGRAPGRLYNVGSFPGMVESNVEGEWVYGEVYELLDPVRTLLVLDRYEGCAPEDKPPRLYERCQAAVQRAGGDTLHCWVYLYRRTVKEGMRILSGDFFDARGSSD
jgi:gamma-glutamylcyclotransferase (GGCT)/AIG2-like uncharacterized protein YtfP